MLGLGMANGKTETWNWTGDWEFGIEIGNLKLQVETLDWWTFNTDTPPGLARPGLADGIYGVLTALALAG